MSSTHLARLAASSRPCYSPPAGRVAEWFKAAVLKTAVGESLPWVRIPPLPPARGLSASGRAGQHLARLRGAPGGTIPPPLQGQADRSCWPGEADQGDRRDAGTLRLPADHGAAQTQVLNKTPEHMIRILARALRSLSTLSGRSLRPPVPQPLSSRWRAPPHPARHCP